MLVYKEKIDDFVIKDIYWKIELNKNKIFKKLIRINE